MDYTNGSLPTNDLPDAGGDFHPGISANDGEGKADVVASEFAGSGSERPHPATGSSTLDSSWTGRLCEQLDPGLDEIRADASVVSPREHSFLLAEDRPIEFRVARGAAPTRRLRLTGNRYTFGSAEGCSIRLSDPKLRPMHAVLIREPSRLIIRAYSVPVLVNDVRVTEATLKIGDRLRLGDYHFELLEQCVSSCGADPIPSPAPSRTTDAGTPNAQTSADQLTSMNPLGSSAVRSAPPPTDETIWRQRLRKEIDQWRHRQAECDGREQRIDEREAHVRGRESELWARAENLYRREAQLQDQESAVYQLHDEYSQRSQELLRLREDAHRRDLSMREREAEFVRQEIEYQSKLAEATEQLTQSRLQAENATDAVTRMRSQFDALNDQIEELSTQQERIHRQESQQREQHQQLRKDLEDQRDQAIDSQAESEARRREAEDRAKLLEEEIDELRKSREGFSEEERKQLQENESVINELTDRVTQLQATVDEAEAESSRLRNGYQDALSSVSQLETLVAQSNERGDQDRSDWAAQTEQLREEIRKLSSDLEHTSEELEDLRHANETLTSRLHEVQVQRDDAVADANSRPTNEALQSLRHELEEANQTLQRMRAELEEAQIVVSDTSTQKEGEPSIEVGPANGQRLLSEALDSESEFSSEAPVDWGGSSATMISDGNKTMTNAPAAETDPPVAQQGHQDFNEDSVDQASADDEAWPTYQTTEDDDTSASNLGVVGDPGGSTWSSQSTDEITQADVSLQEDVEATDTDSFSENEWAATASISSWEDTPVESVEDGFKGVANPWGESPDTEPAWDEPDAAESPSFASENPGVPEMPGTHSDAGEMDGENEPAWPAHDPADSSLVDPVGHTNASEHDENTPVDGSLACLLIDDLKAEASDPSENNATLEGHEESTYDGTQIWSNSEPSVGEPSLDSHARFGSDQEDEQDSPLTDTGRDADDTQVQPSDWQSHQGTMAWDQEFPHESSPDPEDSTEALARWTDDASDFQSDQAASEPSTTASQDDDENPYASAWAEHETDDEASSSGESVNEDASTYGSLEAHGFSTQDLDANQPSPTELGSHDLEPLPGTPSLAGQAEESEPLNDASDSPGEEDDSIEAYMNRLLRRVQGAPDDPGKADSSSVKLSTSVSLDSQVTDSKPVETVSVPEAVDPDAPLVPRSQAPENDTSLSAMRELANESARSAISRSSRVRSRDMQMSAFFNFGGVGAAVLFGLVVSLFLSAQPIVITVVWVMIAIISAIMIREGLKNMGEARKRLAHESQAQQKSAREATGTPTRDSMDPSESADSSLSKP